MPSPLRPRSAAGWPARRSKAALLSAVALACTLWATRAVFGYAYVTPEHAKWPGPAIPIVVKLGASSRALPDGSLSFDSSVERAMMLWNQQMANAKFTWTEAPRTAAPSSDGVTTISFEEKLYGESLGTSTVALTSVRNSGARMIECDVVFNSKLRWDSHFGPQEGQTSYDIHRGALHELGHVLGLDHPDQAHQTVAAIMNAFIGDLDRLQADDAAGARSLYGTAASAPPLDRYGLIANLSTRGNVRTGDSVMIGGFVLQDAPKQVLIRAIGPSLPLADNLADPVLGLFNQNGERFASNNNWREIQQEEIERTGMAPLKDLESALIMTLPPGPFTAIVSGNNNTIGSALVELFDLTPSSGRLANISTRGHVGTGDNVMIAGFFVTGPEAKRLVVRGLGPSLRSVLSGVLPNTTLSLYNGKGELLTSNTGWQNSPTDVAGYQLAPKDPLESAFVYDLVPGAFTAILSSPTGATGIGLVEVFDVSP